MDIIQQVQQLVDDLKNAKEELKNEFTFLNIAVITIGIVSTATLLTVILKKK